MKNVLNVTVYTMKKQCLLLSVVAALAALFCPSMVLATPILGPDLASFTVLGASTVTNVSTSTIVGNVGVYAGTSITGFNSLPGVATADGQVTGGLVHATTTEAGLAEAQLTNAITILGLLGPGDTLLSPDLTLAGPLAPGIYTVPDGTTNLSGALILDGGGNPDAVWIFQMQSTLITSPDSVVTMIDTGSGAGVFWNVRSSATLDTNTTFLGNILAVASISMNTEATILCGRALASTGAVTLGQNSLSGVCSNELAGSNGLSGGIEVITTSGGGKEVIIGGANGEVVVLPAPVPEPGTLLLVGLGLAGLVGLREKLRKS